MQLSPEFLTSLAGALLSLVFAYVPGAKSWFEALDSVKKRLVMVGFLVLATLGVFGIACTPLAAQINLALACTKEDALRLLPMFLAALVANQSTFLVTTASSKKV